MITKNIFTGNISQLIETLQAVKDTEMQDHYLNFAGEKNAGEVLQKLQIGCPKLAKDYFFAESFATQYTSTGTSYNFSNEGLFFDVPTYLTGEPDHWLNETESQQNAQAKDLYICLNTPHWVKETDIFDKLKKIVDYIDESEAKGQRLNVYAKIASFEIENKKNAKTQKDTLYTFLVEIKTESQPINLQQLVYLIASPILLRYCFLYLLRPFLKNKNSNCIGATDLEAENFNKNYIYIPSISYDVVKQTVPMQGKNLVYILSLNKIYNHL